MLIIQISMKIEFRRLVTSNIEDSVINHISRSINNVEESRGRNHISNSSRSTNNVKENRTRNHRSHRKYRSHRTNRSRRIDNN